jgi:signal transduction histidine kinase/DNA-binding response OmpR family regulator/HAMP domain-containing protein
MGQSKIGIRFVLYLLVVALLPLCLVGYITLIRVEETLQRHAVDNLTTIADTRVESMADHFFERYGDAVALSHHPSLATGLVELQAVLSDSGVQSEAYGAACESIRPTLIQYRDAYSYEDILLISVSGDIVFSSSRGEETGANCLAAGFEGSALARVFDQARTLLEPQVSDYRIYHITGEPAVFVATAVLGDRGRVQGVAVLRLSNENLYRFALNYTGLRETGETILATRIGNDAVIISPLRGSSGSAFRDRIVMGSDEGVPIQKALQGEKGHGQFVDYRGKETLAVWRYLPSPRWGLLVKMDAEEIYADISKMKHFGAIIVGSTILFVILSALALLSTVSKKVSKPLEELTGLAKQIAAGDLSNTIAVTSHDEIGELASAFNQMIGNVKEARAQAKESYTELEEENRRANELAGLDAVMTGDKEPAAFGEAVLEYLAPRFDAVVGTFFVREEGNVLRRVSSYALADPDSLPDKVNMGEGLVGQTARENKPFMVSDVPDDYLTIQSSLGSAKPSFLLLTPIAHDGQAIGVIELGTLQPVSGQNRFFLKAAVARMGIRLHSALTRQRTRELLEQTQSQAEALQQQQEELRVVNEELEEQTRALTASQEELQSQQEELQVTNEELEEQKEALEQQKCVLEQKNREVERAKGEIEKKAGQLVQMSRYKSEFLANMSHELRTPLNSLLILARMLDENPDGNLTERQVEFAQTIHRSGSELLDLINDILDLSKVEAGKLTINWEDTYLKGFLEQIDRAFRHIAEAKQLDFVTEISPGLPDYVRTDPKRVEQILKNLLSNACKFCEEGGVSVTFARPSSDTRFFRPDLKPETTVSFSVSDTGIGIPEEKRALIFEAFQQADGTTDRKYGGTGLGLSISRELSRLLGGEIQLESEESKGSTFTLYLPETPATAPEAETNGNSEMLAGEPESASSDAPISQPPSADGKHSPGADGEVPDISPGEKSMLIVEDNGEFASILGDLAKKKGFKKLLAADGMEALKMAETYCPSAILLDIELPGMNGLEVMHKLRENPGTRHIPVHFISGKEETPDARKSGAIGYLKKPVTIEDLNEVFGRVEDQITSRVKHILLAEGDTKQSRRIVKLIKGSDTDVTVVRGIEGAYEKLRDSSFDCMILDLKLPGNMSAFELLEKIQSDDTVSHPSVIVYTDADTSKEDEQRLHQLAQSIVVKGERSPERLLDEVTLFLHRVESELPDHQKKILKALHAKETIFKKKKILVVDDDMRNAFALTHVLEQKGVDVLVGKNGREALTRLDEHPDTSLVLMDIMMPKMDGYEAMRAIRKDSRFGRLPVIALTAKAMKGDREKCMKAGASDYIAKPVDLDRMLSLLRVWLHS